MPEDQPDVLLAQVFAKRAGDEVECYAMAADWLALHGDDMVATMLSNGACALDELAATFGDLPDGRPAPVLAFNRDTQPKGDDDDRPDQPA